MPQRTVQLIPLLCVRCRAPVPAQPGEVAWVCEQCEQGLLLDETPEPLPGACGCDPLDVFFSERVPQGKKGRPFWVAQGQVTISRRETYTGNEERAARGFWAQPRLFYVPAWEAALEEVVQAGVYLLKKPEAMQTGSRVPFLPVVTGPGDVRALAEFMVVSIEAERRDALKRVEFSLSLEKPQLWVLA